MLRLIGHRFLFFCLYVAVVLPAFWWLAAGTAAAQSPAPPSPPSGVATIQYNQNFDDELAAAVVAALEPNHTLRFRYFTVWPDDHVFPNGLSMGQLHHWLTTMIDAWNREPLMPLHLALDRGSSDARNLIRFDGTGSEVGSASGVGGWSYQWDGSGNLTFQAFATIDVRSGANRTREEFEGVAKHEIGHALLLGHTSNRSSAMAYTTNYPDWDAHTGFFALDDLLGLRSVWARNSPGFGGLSGHLLYPDGTAVGAGDIAAVDDQSGEVLATTLSDRKRDGYFRIELPAIRHVRLVAHPLQADYAVLGKDFLSPEMLTTGDFAPTEMLAADRSSVYIVPNGWTRDLGYFRVAAPANPPLLNRDAVEAALLPGERHHLSLRFNQLGTDPVQVRLSLGTLTAENVTKHGSTVDCDVTAQPTAAGVSTVEVRSGAAANLQVGTIWMRPAASVVRAVSIDPSLMVRGGTTDLTVHGLGLDRVTGVRVVREGSKTELPASLAGPATDGSLLVRVTVADNAAEGPWQLVLATATGDAPRAPEPLPRLWTGRGRIRVSQVLDAGDVPVGAPVSFAISVANPSSSRYVYSSAEWISWLGQYKNLKITSWPSVAPGAAGQLRLTVTPTSLGPTVVVFKSKGDSKLDGVTELRMWGVPPAP